MPAELVETAAWRLTALVSCWSSPTHWRWPSGEDEMGMPSTCGCECKPTQSQLAVSCHALLIAQGGAEPVGGAEPAGDAPRERAHIPGGPQLRTAAVSEWLGNSRLEAARL